ncbi:MAG: hypothetical protein LBQ70_00625 [Prevotellaceae bacterium]|jgi:hypothetical protein|nr:hypothetical protein [Prevotellaceae bacterium]
MGDLTGICVVGFIILGIYKTFELFVKKNERVMFIEKFFTHCENKKIDGDIHLPPVSFGRQSNGSVPLRISLLLIGVGMGCFFSFLTPFIMEYGYDIDHIGYNTQGLISFSFIAIFGGLGLLTAYLLESKQSKNK